MDSQASDLYFPEGASGLPVIDYLRRRVSTFRYIAAVHSGTTHYFGTVVLTPDELTRPTAGGGNAATEAETVKIRRRVQKWFGLGIKIGGCLGIPSAGDFVKAFGALVSEYETEHTDGKATNRMKRIFTGRSSSRNSSHIDQAGSGSLSEIGQDASIDAPHMPFEFDYNQVLLSFFEILAVAYEKFLANPDAHRNQSYFDAWMKVDGKIKKIVAVVIKEMENFAHIRFQDEWAQIAASD
ncbi:hypothetical protein BDZ88DRAFT_412926 [Geranomyces variabilis]|nr:hypothetical protein BDZ88DRAFT_412926 [Geranomyces variabilis]KAJ3136880.1 hypothetical protein HDU90_002446 [Geranomyces variabilis]